MASHSSLSKPLRLDWLRRLHPLVYLTAGGWGTLVNGLVTWLCHSALGWPLTAAFGAGLVFNSLFNLWITRTVLRQRMPEDLRSEFSWESFLIIHALLFVTGLALIWFLSSVLKLGVGVSFACAIALVSLLSLFIGRIWIFVSPSAAMIEYEGLDRDFYEASTDTAQVGWFRAWYHLGRFDYTREVVTRLFRPGMTIYDLGCGGSEWNKHGLPVTGVDINEAMLKHGLQRGQLAAYHTAPIDQTGLPTASADLVILTEVLEHMDRPLDILAEVRRLLRPDGIFVFSVPWDTPLSPFFWLFNANCFYRGYILGEEYHRQRCGHINHFTARKVKRVLRGAGLRPEEVRVFRGLLIYGWCRPARRIAAPPGASN